MDDLLSAIRKLQDLYDDPDIVTTADRIKIPEPKQEVKNIELVNDFMKRNPRADGGRIGYNVGTLVGYGTKIPGVKPLLKKGAEALGGTAIGKRVYDTFFSDVQDTGDGTIIRPDANEMEREAKRIREMTKPVGFPAEPPIKIDTTTGETTKPKDFDNIIGGGFGSGEKIELPTSTGGSKIPEAKKEDFIMFNKKADINSLTNEKGKKKLFEIIDDQKKLIPNLRNRKDYERFLKSQEIKIRELPKNQAYKEPAISKEYKKVLSDYVTNYHGGNIQNAGVGLGFDKTITRTLNHRLATINYEPKGNLGQTMLVDFPVGKSNYSDAIFKIKNNPNEFISFTDKLIKNKTVGKNDYISSHDAANILGIDSLNDDQRRNLTNRLMELDIRQKKHPNKGTAKLYHFGDFISEISSYAKDRSTFSNDPNKVSAYNKLRKSREFSPGLQKLESALKSYIRDATKNSSVIIPKINLAEDKGHPESVAVMSRFPELFKKSNLKSDQTLVRQDEFVNQEILVKKGYHKRNENIYKELKNKNIDKIEANALLKQNHNRILDIIKNEALKNKYFKDQEKRIPLLQVDTNGIIQADMSTIDKSFIYGNIDQINPNAKTVSDLSKKEKEMFISNLKDQHIDSAQKFLYNLKDKQGNRVYSNEEIIDYVDMLSVPIDKDSKRTFKFQSGGSVGKSMNIDLSFFAGGGIAKEAGDSSGPPPESGPNPQGLLSLMKHARNY